MKKRCCRCKKLKPTSEFHKNRSRPDGLYEACKTCWSKRQKQYVKTARSPEQRKKRAKRSRGYYRKNREKILARLTALYHTRFRGDRLRREYGLSLEKYDELLSQQGGRCAICKHPPSGRTLSVDHDHSTGKVRGLLCNQCNSALGFFNDNEDRLAAALTYLVGVNSHESHP